jgi:hypothetical protein
MGIEIRLPMRCRYCNNALAPMRSLTDDQFCCDDHRIAFESAGTAGEIPEPEPKISAALRMLRLKFRPKTSRIVEAEVPASEVEFAPMLELPEVNSELASVTGEPEFAPDLVAETEVTSEPIYATAESTSDESVEMPAQEYQQTEESYTEAYEESAEEAAEDSAEDAVESVRPHPAREIASSWRWIHTAWKGAPRDLKVVSLLLPLLLTVAITGSLPKVQIKQVAPQNVAQVEQAVNEHWKNLNQTISDRAGIAYADDFRAGLDAWESRSNLTTSWSYDQAGFVRPGPLAVFKPTVDLADYRFEFLGEIDQKALGWAFRARDLNNYYAMKFVVVKPGPLPLVHMVRYAVINGKEGPHVDKPLPMTVRNDMLYRVQVNVRGSDFTIMAQGQIVDFWSDSRLRQGGIGFFCSRGERARLRWVEVSHQYDALGRLCAYLAPYGIEGRNGNIN